MSRLDDIILEAVVGFSQEESISIAFPEEKDPFEEGLIPIKFIPLKKIERGGEYSTSTVKWNDAFRRGEYNVGSYSVKLAISLQEKVSAACTCIDFAIHGRNEESGCKHIAAVLISSFPGILKKITESE
ncbi:MAG TPA: SWIM zinc finger family protein [Euryarchaeota archaeon]|nr:SWIM zinc finger family protein [Euryarchaeota archaeon]